MWILSHYIHKFVNDNVRVLKFDYLAKKTTKLSVLCVLLVIKKYTKESKMWNRNKNAESHQNESEKSADDDYESMPIDSNDAENRFEHAQVQIITCFINSDWKMTKQKKTSQTFW